MGPRNERAANRGDPNPQRHTATCLLAQTTVEPLSEGVRHPRAFALGEWAAADVRPYAAPKEQMRRETRQASKG